MDTLEKAIITKIVSRRLRGEEDLYFTMTCQMQGTDANGIKWACGQRFKFLKHAGGQVICPRCGMHHDVSTAGLRQAISAIPVD